MYPCSDGVVVRRRVPMETVICTHRYIVYNLKVFIYIWIVSQWKLLRARGRAAVFKWISTAESEYATYVQFLPESALFPRFDIWVQYVCWLPTRKCSNSLLWPSRRSREIEHFLVGNQHTYCTQSSHIEYTTYVQRLPESARFPRFALRVRRFRKSFIYIYNSEYIEC